jgi:hypothetical protein
MKFMRPEITRKPPVVLPENKAVNLVQNFRTEYARQKPGSTQNCGRYAELLENLVRVLVLSRGRTNLRSLIENWSLEHVTKVAGKSAATHIRPKGKCRR